MKKISTNKKKYLFLIPFMASCNQAINNIQHVKDTVQSDNTSVSFFHYQLSRVGNDVDQAKDLLLVALKNGDTDFLKKWLKSTEIGADTLRQYFDNNGYCTTYTLLHLAVMSGYSKMVKLVLEDPRINVNIRNSRGVAPLHLAIGVGCPEIVQILLQHPQIDVNIDLAYADKYRPIHLAATTGNAKIFELLIKHPKIKVNVQTAVSNTALHIAARKGLTQICSLLLQHQEIDVNAYDKPDYGSTERSFTPLHFAARNGHLEVVKLLAQDPKIDIKTKNSWNPLHEASYGGHVSIVEYFLQDGRIDPNDKSEYSSSNSGVGNSNQRGGLLNLNSTNLDTPLHVAARQGHKSVVECLLGDQRTKISLINAYGYNALHLAILRLHKPIVEFLWNHPKIDRNKKISPGDSINIDNDYPLKDLDYLEFAGYCCNTDSLLDQLFFLNPVSGRQSIISFLKQFYIERTNFIDLKSDKYIKHKKDKDIKDSHEECMICYNTQDRPLYVFDVCLHHIHKECYESLIANKSHCPYCRVKVVCSSFDPVAVTN